MLGAEDGNVVLGVAILVVIEGKSLEDVLFLLVEVLAL